MFRFRVNLGKFELDTSMRMRCPGAKKSPVDSGLRFDLKDRFG